MATTRSKHPAVSAAVKAAEQRGYERRDREARLYEIEGDINRVLSGHYKGLEPQVLVIALKGIAREIVALWEAIER